MVNFGTNRADLLLSITALWLTGCAAPKIPDSFALGADTDKDSPRVILDHTGEPIMNAVRVNGATFILKPGEWNIRISGADYWTSGSAAQGYGRGADDSALLKLLVDQTVSHHTEDVKMVGFRFRAVDHLLIEATNATTNKRYLKKVEQDSTGNLKTISIPQL